MMRVIKKIIESDNISEIKQIPSEWNQYYTKLLMCHRLESKCRILMAQIIDTSNRLQKASNHGNVEYCESIKIHSNDLHFCFGDIPIHNIQYEQKMSMKIIHEYALNKDYATLVFDFSNFSTKFFYSLLKSVTRENIIDGYRLWSTIPCNVKHVTIIQSESVVWGVILKFGMSFLTEKMKQRITYV